MKKFSAILFAVVLSVVMVVPAFASSVGGYPDLYRTTEGTFSISEHYKANKAEYPNLTYVLSPWSESDGTSGVYLFRSNDGFYYDVNDLGKANLYCNGTWESFILSEDGTHFYYNSTSTYPTVYSFDGITWSSDTIYSTDGELKLVGDPNFPMPLWAEVEQATQGGMTEMTRDLGGMMTILVPCGVGCLALLTVLRLFGRRSLIFRS